MNENEIIQKVTEYHLTLACLKQEFLNTEMSQDRYYELGRPTMDKIISLGDQYHMITGEVIDQFLPKEIPL